MKETRVENKDKKAIARFANPIVKIQAHAWQKMYGWCRAAQSECSGMGLARIENDGSIVVYEVFFPKQYCSSGWTELDEEHLSALQQKLFLQGRDLAHFRFWWHTHYNFDTFWSGQDEKMAQTLAKTNGEWQLSIVINQKGDYRCRIDFIKPINFVVDDIEVKVIPNDRKRKRKRNYKADVRKWVHPMPIRIPTTPRSGESYVWSKNELIKIGDAFKGTEWEKQVAEWISKRLAKRSYARRVDIRQQEKLKDAFGEKGEWVNEGGILRKRTTESQCSCMHSGFAMDCFCIDSCNICVSLREGVTNDGEPTVQKSIWPS